jgi:hypothetical protein
MHVDIGKEDIPHIGCRTDKNTEKVKPFLSEGLFIFSMEKIMN